MTAHTKIGGEWKEFDPNVKVGDSWYPVDNGYVKVGGVWKEFYSSFSPLFVAVSADFSDAAATSPDGITWTARTLPSNETWQSVTSNDWQ